MIKPTFISKHALSTASLVLLCVVLFANTLQSELLWDDNYLITDNQYIKSLENIPLFFTPRYWNSLHPLSAAGQYRPVRTATFAVDYFFWQLRPAGYHLTNLLLHTGNVLLVYCLIHLLTGGLNRDDKNSRWFFSLPFLTALLFAAHPVHTESIAFVKNRAELLACFFFLTAFIVFIKISHPKGARSRGLLLPAALLCFGLAVCAKEVALVLPAILVLYAACFLSGAKRRRAILYTLPFWGGIFLFVWFRQVMLTTSSVAAPSPLPRIATAPIGPWQTLLAVCKTCSHYLSLLIFPVNLHITPAFQVPRTIFTPVMAVSAASILMLGLLIVFSYKRSRRLCFGTGWTLLTLLPASNMVYLASRPIAEQRLYLPSIGFCLIAAMALRKLFVSDQTPGIRPSRRSKNIAVAILSVILIFYSLQTIHRNKIWRTSLTFWADGVNTSPRNMEPYNGLGMAYNDLQDSPRAIDCLRKGLALRKLQPEKTDPLITAALYCNLGVAHNQAGHPRKADEAFRKALAIYKQKVQPDHPVIAKLYNNIGLACFNKADYNSAAFYLKQALHIHLRYAGRQHPDTASLYNNLGGVYLKKRDYNQAIPYLQQALQIKTELLGGDHPSLATGYDNLGVAYYRAENYLQAISFLKQALTLYEKKPAVSGHKIITTRQHLATAEQEYNRRQMPRDHTAPWN